MVAIAMQRNNPVLLLAADAAARTGAPALPALRELVRLGARVNDRGNVGPTLAAWGRAA